MAAFSRAVYLLAEEELFWITGPDVPMHRRSAALSGPLPRITAGSVFRFESTHLVIDSFSMDAAATIPWRAPQPGLVLGLDALPARIDSVFSSMDLSGARGFGLFIPQILRPSRAVPAGQLPAAAAEILLHARPLVLGLARACLEQDGHQAVKNADALVGLGEGLTPSGDDLLGGLFFALRTLQTIYGCPDFIDPQPIVERYAAQTNRISYTLLKDLALGHGLAPLHEIVNGLLGGRHPAEIDPLINELTRTGHSTGWDLLAGLLTGLLSVCQAGDRNSSLRLRQAVQG